MPLSTYNVTDEDRQKALLAALYHHDGVSVRRTRGDVVRVEMRVDYPEADVPALEDTRKYVKTVGHALGFTFSSRGMFGADLRPKF